MYYSGTDLLIDWYQSVNAQDTHHNGILFNHLEYVYLQFYSVILKLISMIIYLSLSN